MAKILDLQAEVRTQSGTGAVKRMRKAGTIPAALYGRTAKLSRSFLKAAPLTTFLSR
jgi:large subunit ribosomal protein L25